MAPRVDRTPRQPTAEPRRGRVPESVTEQVEALSEGLRVDKHNLDEELVDNGEKFHKIADAVALATSRRDAAKDELKLTEAEVGNTIRIGLVKEGTKATVDGVAAMVLMHADVRAAQERLRARDEELGRLLALKESYNQRSYAIKDLVSLHLAAYFGTTGKIVRRDIEEDDGERRRERARKEMTDNRLANRNNR